jgi:hypothetical protein
MTAAIAPLLSRLFKSDLYIRAINAASHGPVAVVES